MKSKAKQRKTAPAAKMGNGAAKRHQDEILDEALEETFPASDPVELTPPRRPKRS